MDTSATDRVSFNTDILPERDRFPAFCEGMFRHVIGADIVRLDAAPFRAALDIRRVGAVGIADISITSAEIARRASHVGDGNDALVVQLWRCGPADMAQGKHESRIESQDGVIIDNAKPATIRTRGPARFLSLEIPRQRMGAVKAPAHLTGAKVIANPAFRLLFNYLKEMSSESSIDRRVAVLIGNHLVDLANFAIGAPGPADATDGVRCARRVAILREIERRSGDADLSAAAMALQLGVTPRYVHLLLEETGKSFTHHVLERRLETAAALLRSPSRRHHKVADIAAEAGFADLSYFNRAFRRHYGATPSDLRVSPALNRSPSHIMPWPSA